MNSRQLPEISEKDVQKDRAVADCINFGTPTLGIDHSSHYRPRGGKGPTLAELTKATMKAFNIQEKE